MNAYAGSVVALALAGWALVPWPPARWACALVALYLGLGALWSWILRRGLVASADDPVLRTFSGRRLTLGTRVENRSPLPSGLLFLADSSGGLETWGVTRRWASLGPFSLRRDEISVRGRERGVKVLGPQTISGVDPTGLFPFRLEAPARTLVVYPPLRPVEGWGPDGQPSGARRWEPAFADDVSRFRAHRDFEAGDPLARVSAQAWARVGAPQVRTYDRTVARPTLVVADLRAGAYPLRLRWALVEAAVETAASLVWESLGRGETLWLAVLDAAPDQPAVWGPARGWAAARPLLERLARAVPDRREPPGAPALAVPKGPQRALWVGPPGVDPGLGLETLILPIEEARTHGPIPHP